VRNDTLGLVRGRLRFDSARLVTKPSAAIPLPLDGIELETF
jgi:hypothetical protein